VVAAQVTGLGIFVFRLSERGQRGEGTGGNFRRSGSRLLAAAGLSGDEPTSRKLEAIQLRRNVGAGRSGHGRNVRGVDHSRARGRGDRRGRAGDGEAGRELARGRAGRSSDGKTTSTGNGPGGENHDLPELSGGALQQKTGNVFTSGLRLRDDSQSSLELGGVSRRILGARFHGRESRE